MDLCHPLMSKWHKFSVHFFSPVITRGVFRKDCCRFRLGKIHQFSCAFSPPAKNLKRLKHTTDITGRRRSMRTQIDCIRSDSVASMQEIAVRVANIRYLIELVHNQFAIFERKTPGKRCPLTYFSTCVYVRYL